MKNSIIAVIILTSCIQSAYCAEEQINTVALFKNGSGYFVSSLEIEAGSLGFDVVPQAAAAHGSFWISWGEGLGVQSVIAEPADYSEKIEATTISELLRANIGSEVRIDCGEEFFTGEIIAFDITDAKEQLRPYAPGKDIYIPYNRQEVLTLKTAAGVMIVNAEQISRLTFLSGEFSRDGSRDEKRIKLTGSFVSPAKEGKVWLQYLAKGITWVPSYMVDITDEDTATLSAKTLVINEAADLDNTRLLLITGYPQLQYADVFSPISMKNSLDEFLAAIGAGSRLSGGGNMMAKQRVMAFDMAVAEAAPSVSYGAAASGLQVEDMFFYPVDGVSLKKNQSAYYPLFSEQLACKHIYKWDIADNVDSYYRYNSSASEQEQVVWHCIRLENSTELPWTSAPVAIVKSGLLLGQSTLDFILPKDEATVKISAAPSIKAKQNEYVSNRVPNAANFFGTNYDEVTIDAELYVSNTKGQSVDVEISKTITGKLVSTNPKPESSPAASNIGNINPTSKLNWTQTIPAGEEIKITYSYKAYLRR